MRKSAKLNLGARIFGYNKGIVKNSQPSSSRLAKWGKYNGYLEPTFQQFQLCNTNLVKFLLRLEMYLNV